MIFDTIYDFYQSLFGNSVDGFYTDAMHVDFLCSFGTYFTIIMGIVALFRILGGVLKLFKV